MIFGEWLLKEYADDLHSIDYQTALRGYKAAEEKRITEEARAFLAKHFSKPYQFVDTIYQDAADQWLYWAALNFEEFHGRAVRWGDFCGTEIRLGGPYKIHIMTNTVVMSHWVSDGGHLGHWFSVNHGKYDSVTDTLTWLGL